MGTGSSQASQRWLFSHPLEPPSHTCSSVFKPSLPFCPLRPQMPRTSLLPISSKRRRNSATFPPPNLPTFPHLQPFSLFSLAPEGEVAFPPPKADQDHLPLTSSKMLSIACPSSTPPSLLDHSCQHTNVLCTSGHFWDGGCAQRWPVPGPRMVSPAMLPLPGFHAEEGAAVTPSKHPASLSPEAEIKSPCS